MLTLIRNCTLRPHHPSPTQQTSLAFARTWHSVSAKDRVLGPLAVNIAKLLMGKHKPIYDQSKDLGDYVVVTNAKQVVVTGRKADQRVYRHHTMFPGGLKEIKYKEMMEKKPEEIIRKAVSGMLPKNTLRDRRLERLKVFEGEEHPYKQNVLSIDKPQPKVQSKMLARDQELLSKLLEREGGSAGVSIVNGRYEEGLGPETKKNMFRLI
ncbi:60S ribosomal protein [Pseudozyma hubeiensis SY62]|uniref:60S ribosomal protein n=1 Tax=Pseudozyma hubeiensis (strain SY62) TaxID=1305764 RepID=R9P278_PSEHS|nr:60S ribosomal protein [Pseudozyma hubeiensis SY62]GAC95478.1 60S ribosomal protein [Pseudozyma hubeiensis SY62]